MAQNMKEAAAANAPFSDEELAAAIGSLKRLLTPDSQGDIDWVSLRALYAERAHLSHKDWTQTEASAATLASIIGTPDSPVFQTMFARVLEDGNWKGAAQRPEASGKPWIVLVTGLNGIRKTTSIYQPWWKQVLQQALASQFRGEAAELPAGTDSFFRQLDYMIATLALEQFQTLYGLGDDVELYAEFKAAIFARYRTVAEMLGILLCKCAQRRGLNVMVETSGRDVGMFKYVDHVFPGGAYRKLVVHFAINDISFAERSVDARMLDEMRRGSVAVEHADRDPLALVRANAGGPYGSKVLAGVLADGERVWKSVVDGEALGDAGDAWLKASISIQASDIVPWRAMAASSAGASIVAGVEAASHDEFEFAPL